MRRSFHHLLLCFGLLSMGMISHGGVTQYTDRGKADFDTALQILNPYGTWSKIDDSWAFTPLDHLVPYTNGRWIYTQCGWYWKGTSPHSWITEHYGYWKRGADKVWSWYPGPYWLPQIVEIRATDSHIGWRCAAVDQEGNFTEAPIDRYSKSDEWTFVTRAQFANPITPGIISNSDVAEKQLADSTDSRHTYLTYRAIERIGPHPADFLNLCKDGGMFAPKTLRDALVAQSPASNLPVPEINLNEPPAKARDIAAKPLMTATNTSTLMGTDIDPETDTRKVKYWITMSLPTYWTPPPPTAKPEEIYLYRPDFYQDEDGIARRITLWFNPQSCMTLQDVLKGNQSSGNHDSDTTRGVPSTQSSNPFRPLLDEPFHSYATAPASDSSSNAPSSPSPTNLQNVPIPLPVTNTAPMNP